MRRNRISILLLLTGLAFVVAAAVFLMSAEPALAQCGSQASSCKNCHEVQGELPVNGDGTGWHTGHAFGDFCVICHAGNNQAKEAGPAHEGMIPPMDDVQAACQQCHAPDLEARAQVYADALGVSYGMGGSAPAPAGTQAAPAGGQPSPASLPGTDCDELVVDDANATDYVARYNEIVLGRKPVNVGNAILWAMIAMLAIGGGAFVIINEKLVRVSFGDTKQPPKGYPADVVDLLPALAALKASTRKALRKLIENPRKAEKALGLMQAVLSDEDSKEEES